MEATRNFTRGKSAAERIQTHMVFLRKQMRLVAGTPGKTKGQVNVPKSHLLCPLPVPDPWAGWRFLCFWSSPYFVTLHGSSLCFC